MIKENLSFEMIGETKDIIYHKNGLIEETPWERNTMVTNLNVLVASLLKEHSGYGGISYWAIGSGTDNWDVPPIYERLSLKILSTASTSGNIVITLNNAQTTVSISVNDNAASVANKIKLAHFPGWKMESGASNEVIFVSLTEGPKVNNSYSAGSTGANGSLTVLEAGRTSQPRPNPNKNDTKCLNEIYRKKIQPENIKFLSNVGNVTSTPTNILEITLVFGENEAIGKWREFCIFGGDASNIKDSGLNINRRTHGLLEKTSDMIIERKIKFTFQQKE